MKDPLARTLNAYEILKMPEIASETDINAAFANALRQGEDPYLLNAARDTLLKPERRAIEDLLLIADDFFAALGIDADLSLENERKNVIDYLLQQLKTRHQDPKIIHTLAVLVYWSAIASEQGALQVSQPTETSAVCSLTQGDLWKLAIALWTHCIVSYNFWSDWAATRRGYAISDEEMIQAFLGLNMHLSLHFSRRAEDCLKHGDHDGRSTYLQYNDLLSREMRAAEALAVEQIDILCDGRRCTLVCGPLLADQIGQLEAIRSELRRRNSPVLRYFSSDPEIAALITNQPNDEAVGRGQTCAGGEQGRRELCELSASDWLEQGNQQWSEGQRYEAFASWRSSFSAGGMNEADARAIKGRILLAATAMMERDVSTAEPFLEDALRVVDVEELRKLLAVCLLRRGTREINDTIGGLVSRNLSHEEISERVLYAVELIVRAAMLDPASESIRDQLRAAQELVEPIITPYRYCYAPARYDPDYYPEQHYYHERRDWPHPSQGTSDVPGESDTQPVSQEVKKGKLARFLSSMGAMRSLWSSRTKKDNQHRAMNPEGEPELPLGHSSNPPNSGELFDIDVVRFTITGPRVFIPLSANVLTVWVHRIAEGEAVRRMAWESGGGAGIIGAKGPVKIARGTMLTFRLVIDGIEIDDPEDTVFWDGEIANCTFAYRVPEHVEHGTRIGKVFVYYEGLQIMRIDFGIRVSQAGSSKHAELEAEEKPVRSAFVSYSSKDESEVVTVLQGVQKANKKMKVFYARKDIPSGAKWKDTLRTEIQGSDVFYLFWSENAAASHYVEKEWKCALNFKGIDFIDPFPLVSPDVVPPPRELSDLHFDTWHTKYKEKEIKWHTSTFVTEQ